MSHTKDSKINNAIDKLSQNILKQLGIPLDEEKRSCIDKRVKTFFKDDIIPILQDLSLEVRPKDTSAISQFLQVCLTCQDNESPS